MDEMKFKQAWGMLHAVEEQLPRNGDIKEKYVVMFHQTLADIQNATGLDLTYYSIPPSEINPHVISSPGRPRVGSFEIQLEGDRGPKYSEDRYCERARFLMAIRGAINFVNSLMTQPGRRAVGFTQPE